MLLFVQRRFYYLTNQKADYMSNESAPSSTQPDLPGWDRIENMPEELQLEELEAIVGSYDLLASQAEYKDESGNIDSTKLNKKIDAAIRQYLAQADFVAEDDSNATDEDKQAYALAYSVIERAMHASREEWIGSIDANGHSTSLAVGLHKELLAFYRPAGRHRAEDNHDDSQQDQDDTHDAELDRSDNDILPTDEAIAMNQEFDELNEKLTEARSKWAKASSKRLGRAFSIKDADRAKLKKEYEELVRERGRWALDNNVLLNEDRALYADLSEEDRDDLADGKKLYKRGRNDAVIDYLFDEQEQLRTETLENLQSTKVSKFVQWMNKGNIAQRVAKGMTLGAVAGVGGGLLAGAAGAGIVAAGAIGVSRFVKGYAAKDRRRGSKMTARLAEEDVDVFKESTDTSVVLNVDESQTKTDELFEISIKDEQKERFKALGVGAVSVALGAGLGFAVTELSGKSGVINEKIQSLWDDNAKDLTPGADDATSGDIYPNNDYDNDNIPNDQDVAPRNPNIGAIDFHELSHDARWIEAGEGGFQTLKELGIPEAKWEAIWADAGESFAEEGKTYLMDDGRYGWSQPGRLSNADILELARAARRNGVVLDMALVA